MTYDHLTDKELIAQFLCDETLTSRELMLLMRLELADETIDDLEEEIREWRQRPRVVSSQP